MKLPFVILYLLGFVLICTLRTPVKYYPFYDHYIVIQTHIFSNKGRILVGQFMGYHVVWAAFVWLTYLLFKYIKKA